MQRTDFEKRWETMHEWVATPRAIVERDDFRVVARRSDVEKKMPIEFITEKRGKDSMGGPRWVENGDRLIVCGWWSEAACYAWLALMEQAHGRTRAYTEANDG